MRYIKMLGLLALAALAMAIVGTGSASATVLCKENVGVENECPEGKIVSLPATVNASAPVTLEGEGTWGCSNSTMTLKLEKNLGSGKPIEGQVTSLSLEGCNVWWCGKAEGTHLPYKAQLSISPAKDGSGILKLSSSGNGNPAIRFNECNDNGGIPIGSCTYGTSNLELDWSTLGVIDASKEKLSREESSVYCKPVGAWEMSAGYADVARSFSASSTEMSIVSTAGNTTCESTMSGTLGSISNLTFSGCKGTCTSGSALNLPYSVKWESSSVEVSKGGSANPLWEFKNCFGVEGLTCKYGFSTAILDRNGATSLVAKEEPLTREGGSALCSISAKWNGTYSLSGSDHLWLVSNP